jgi:hypothetical protein
MSAVTGIEYEKDDEGNNQYVRYDLSKYGNIVKPIIEYIEALNKQKEEADKQQFFKNMQQYFLERTAGKCLRAY